jgi:hypothetical protein
MSVVGWALLPVHSATGSSARPTRYDSNSLLDAKAGEVPVLLSAPPGGRWRFSLANLRSMRFGSPRGNLRSILAASQSCSILIEVWAICCLRTTSCWRILAFTPSSFAALNLSENPL